jgi:hypothetical protein
MALPEPQPRFFQPQPQPQADLGRVLRPLASVIGLTRPLLLASLVVLAPAPAWAGGDGHGHDHGPATPAAEAGAWPRFAAESELFELVGVLQGRRLSLYLDRAADNTPVTEARIALELAGRQLPAQPQADGSFLVQLPAEPAPGLLAVTATVQAGQDTDLLVAELDLHAAHAHADEAPAAPAWRSGIWAAAGLMLGLALSAAWHRRRGAPPAAEPAVSPPAAQSPSAASADTTEGANTRTGGVA